MKRTLVVVAAVVGFAAAASAGTLTVFTTDASNVVRSSFSIGETILLKVEGNSEGGQDSAIQAGVQGYGNTTSFVSVTQPQYLPSLGGLPGDDTQAIVLSQTSATPQLAINPTGTSIVTLVADAVGLSEIHWAGSVLDFFGLYSYPPPTGVIASFTVIPEPATAGLIGLGLLGLVLGGRRRA